MVWQVAAFIPPALSSLPKTHLAHTSELINFTILKGKSIAVVGAAASAFDAAAAALESGAANVHLFARRPAVASVPINRVRGYPGAYDNYRIFLMPYAGSRRCAFETRGQRHPPMPLNELRGIRTSICISAPRGRLPTFEVEQW